MRELRENLGIREGGKSPIEDKLTPLAEITPESFEAQKSSEILARSEDIEVLTPKQLAFAQLSVKAYEELSKQMRQESQKSQHHPIGKLHEKRGVFAKIVGKISVKPIGPEGRFGVNFTVTNFSGEDDWAAEVTIMVFDITSENLNEAYPAREKHWVVGKKDNNYENIGVYKKLYEKSNGKVAELLADMGYTDIGEVWAADVNRHSGFFNPPASK
jgi:hypothetical protein